MILNRLNLLALRNLRIICIPVYYPNSLRNAEVSLIELNLW